MERSRALQRYMLPIGKNFLKYIDLNSRKQKKIIYRTHLLLFRVEFQKHMPGSSGL